MANEAAFYCAVKDMSAKRLEALVARIRKSECECDDYVGFKCDKHWRLSIAEHFLERTAPTPNHTIG